MDELVVAGDGGIRLRCDAYGDPDGVPVVLLHGLGRTRDDWTHITNVLAEEHWVLSQDARGHGASDYPGVYSFELMRDDLLAMLDDLEIARASIVGHSMGATVAYLFVESHPERVERLVIEDTPPPRVEKTGFQSPPFDWPLGRMLTEQLNNPDPAWWDDLATIRVPTLIVGGGSTSHVNGSELEEVANVIANCRLVTFEGAGHNVHGTMPDEFLGVVRPFLCGEEIPDA